jgi:hypothetical protein
MMTSLAEEIGTPDESIRTILARLVRRSHFSPRSVDLGTCTPAILGRNGKVHVWTKGGLSPNQSSDVVMESVRDGGGRR